MILRWLSPETSIKDILKVIDLLILRFLVQYFFGGCVDGGGWAWVRFLW